MEEESQEYEVERVIGKRITFEDAETHTDEEEEREEKQQQQPPSDDELERKYDEPSSEEERKVSSPQPEEVKERDESTRRVTRATTRQAREEVSRRRQAVSVHMLRLPRARGQSDHGRCSEARGRVVPRAVEGLRRGGQLVGQGRGHARG